MGEFKGLVAAVYFFCFAFAAGEEEAAGAGLLDEEEIAAAFADIFLFSQFFTHLSYNNNNQNILRI